MSFDYILSRGKPPGEASRLASFRGVAACFCVLPALPLVWQAVTCRAAGRGEQPDRRCRLIGLATLLDSSSSDYYFGGDHARLRGLIAIQKANRARAGGTLLALPLDANGARSLAYLSGINQRI